MANYDKNPAQIIRLDGRDCFMEVMNSAFIIDKVLMGFYAYDQSRQSGDKFTRKIQIYMSLKDFYAFYYDVMITGQLIRKINALASDPTKNDFDKQVILSRGGSKKNGKITARILKIQKGAKQPIIFRAEEGNGKENAKGGYTMDGKPSQYVIVPISYEDLKSMLSMTHEALAGHFAMLSMKNKMDELLFEQKRTQDLIALLVRCSGNGTLPDFREILDRKMPKPWEKESGQQPKPPQQSYNNQQPQNYGDNGYYPGYYDGPPY